MFAKLYENTRHGQILVKAGENDEGCPEVRFYFQPGGFGICETALSWDNSDDGCDKADQAFIGMTQEQAEKIVDGVTTGLFR